ncbi:MAG TPA: lysophospholipid acyltransferase family protein [Kofleriaceae bacterium]|nr:lysophospholipid acyltransferase family protein [Kofleriaceae bacterium]
MISIERPHDDGLGYDVFGLHRPSVVRAVAAGKAPFERWFRVESRGHEHIPAHGAAILVANHSGALPVDGAMLWLDVVRHTGRIPRPIADHFVAHLPLVRTAFARVGVVDGTVANVDRLLARGELCAIFPEGTRGMVKRFRDRYHLQRWNLGHVELAIRHRAPIVPVAIIGAEESWPLIARLPVHPFGAPYVPVPLTPIPLPVPYHLRYGAPIDVGASDDPETIALAGETVRAAVAALVDETRRMRGA